MSQSPSETKSKRRILPRGRWWKIALVVVLLVGGWFYFRTPGSSTEKAATWTVKQGPLVINVVESGSIEALEKQEIRSEVEGQTKILSIVEEGYQVSEDDVKNKKVLVKLDSAELTKGLTNAEIEYQGALATYADSREQFEIQIKQNESDIRTALLDAKFKRIEFERYMSAELADRILKEAGLNVDLEEYETSFENFDIEKELDLLNAAPAESSDAPAEESGAPAEGTAKPEEKVKQEKSPSRPPIDFAQYAKEELLGDGEAHQKLRKIQSDAMVASEELALSEKQFEGTKRLYDAKFVTENEMKNDEMKRKRSEISQESAETAQQLFMRYEFPKDAEKKMSDYEEALSKFERTRKQAISKLAQAQAKLKSSEARFRLETKQRDKFKEQIAKCEIVAERAGLVVYAGSEEFWRGDQQIEEGATVRQYQSIITIPDITKMSVKVKVHEASVKKVLKGQKADIRIDAYPETPLTGEVQKVALLPSSSSRWMNPDVKLYDVTISIDGAREWLKPGMSAEVTIKIKEIPNVVQAPLQAIFPVGGKRMAYVVTALGGTDPREVEVGEYNDSFIEIKKGLKDGETVLLRAPMTEAKKKHGTQGEDSTDGNAEEKSKQKGSERPKESRPEKPEASDAPAPPVDTAMAASSEEAAPKENDEKPRRERRPENNGNGGNGNRNGGGGGA